MKKRAFTLIELLVVIAIIAILAAILFPVFARARSRAQTTTCASNQRQLSHALLMYAEDFNERIPRWWTPDGNNTNPTKPRDWRDDSINYYKSRDVMICPAYPHRKNGISLNFWAAWRDGMRIGVNKQPSQMCMLSESDDFHNPRNPTNSVDRVAPYKWESQGDGRFSWDINRHNGGANMTFMDGHTRWIKYAPQYIDWKPAYASITTGTDLSPFFGTPLGTYFWPSATSP